MLHLLQHVYLSLSIFLADMAAGWLSRPIPFLDHLEGDGLWDPALLSRVECFDALFEGVVSFMGDEVAAGESVADWLAHPVVKGLVMVRCFL